MELKSSASNYLGRVTTLALAMQAALFRILFVDYCHAMCV